MISADMTNVQSDEYVCPPESGLSQGADNCSTSRLFLVLFSFYVNSHRSKQRLQPVSPEHFPVFLRI